MAWSPTPVLDRDWAANARLTLHGGSTAKDLCPGLMTGSSDEEIHLALLSMVESGNSDRSIAGRMQSHPESVERLLGADSVATGVAWNGSAYNFTQRPYQYKRPRPVSLSAESKKAASAEVDRLRFVCGAVETAPSHDGDKCLLSSTVGSWERSDLRVGPWPRERRVPVLSSDAEVRAYDLLQVQEERRRLESHRPHRDFESTVFTVPKSDGGHRLCTDYRRLNEFQKKRPFKMEGVQSVADLIQPGDYGMLVDLKDAYLTMGLHPAQRKYCRFRSPKDGARLQWRTVSFGMSEAPRMCTKLLKPIIGLLKGIGIRCLIYIDDLLVLDQDRDRLARAMAIAMNLLQDQIGLQIKVSKCSFHPSRTFKCLGLIWDTCSMTVSIPPSRLKAAQKVAKRLIKTAETSPVPTRDLARFCGQITSMTRGIRGAKRYLLFIQQALGHAVRRTGFTGTTSLNKEGVEALRWWTTEQPWLRQGQDIVQAVRPLQGKVQSDAASANLGWGGTLQIGAGKTFSTRGYFTGAEMHLHINALELLGCWYTIRSLLPLALSQDQWNRVHLSCDLDSIVAIKYAKVAVSRSLNLSRLGAEFFDWKERHQIQASYAHLAGILNVRADELSRVAWSALENKLDSGLFRAMQKEWHAEVEIDLFASRQNRQVPRYFTWDHDWESEGVDSLNHPWTMSETVYAYPPPVLILRVLQKMMMESVNDLILIAPVWPTQPWWPALIDSITEIPLLLPSEGWVTRDPGQNPSWEGPFCLAAFRLSGVTHTAKGFQRSLWRQFGRQKSMDIIRRKMLRLSNSHNISELSATTLGASVHGVLQPVTW